MIPNEQRLIWQKAQEAEKGHWIELWDKNVQKRQQILDHEAQKADFIFHEMASHFSINPKTDWTSASILDVGCGPTSLIARSKLGKKRTGVDPLKYPNWIYEIYQKNDFEVLLEPFEELKTYEKFDIIIFYNALQHFANLGEVARKCKNILAKNGTIYLSEYLEVPTNEAHIQFLEAARLDGIFEGAGFLVDSFKKSVRLPGLVELPGGLPISLYIARITCG